MNTYFHNTYYNLVDNFGQTIFCEIVFGWQSTTKEVKHALFYFENKTCFANNGIHSGEVACLAQRIVPGLALLRSCAQLPRTSPPLLAVLSQHEIKRS